MDIKLYNNTSDYRSLNKAITEIKTISVRLKDNTDIMRPVIELDSANLPPTANYCYIPSFKRYYYINQQGIAIGRDLMLTLDIDVLMSWREYLLNNAVVTAARSSNLPNKKLPDNIPVLANKNVIYKAFTGGNKFFGSDKVTKDSYCYLLTVSAGGYS